MSTDDPGSRAPLRARVDGGTVAATTQGLDGRPRPIVTFEDNAFDEAERAANAEWRQMTRYERTMLDVLLSVEFEGCARLKRESVRVRCRMMDRCGCIEFEPGATLADRNYSQVVSEADGPRLPDGRLVDLMLSTRGGHLLWMEFHRFGTDVTFCPPASDFAPYAYGAARTQ